MNPPVGRNQHRTRSVVDASAEPNLCRDHGGAVPGNAAAFSASKIPLRCPKCSTSSVVSWRLDAVGTPVGGAALGNDRRGESDERARERVK